MKESTKSELQAMKNEVQDVVTAFVSAVAFIEEKGLHEEFVEWANNNQEEIKNSLF